MIISKEKESRKFCFFFFFLPGVVPIHPSFKDYFSEIGELNPKEWLSKEKF